MGPVKWVSQNAPEFVLSVLRPIYRNSRSWVLGIADSMKFIGPEKIYDDEYYAKRREDPWRSDAHAVASAIQSHFSPNSVIDFGCAIGAHLEPFYNENLEIKGVEGNPEAFKHAVVPTDYLVRHDLREPYDPERSYDLALCFEVAEHLPKQYAGVLVDTLTEASDTIVMTAATPGQGGTHHVNEQPPEYWHQKFESHGFEHSRKSAAGLCKDIDTNNSKWIQDNLMVFRSK